MGQPVQKIFFMGQPVFPLDILSASLQTLVGMGEGEEGER